MQRAEEKQEEISKDEDIKSFTAAVQQQACHDAAVSNCNNVMIINDIFFLMIMCACAFIFAIEIVNDFGFQWAKKSEIDSKNKLINKKNCYVN